MSDGHMAAGVIAVWRGPAGEVVEVVRRPVPVVCAGRRLLRGKGVSVVPPAAEYGRLRLPAGKGPALSGVQAAAVEADDVAGWPVDERPPPVEFVALEAED